MRTALFTIAAAASALAFAAPASAQWFPQPRGQAYGYYNHGFAQRLDARAEILRRHIFNLHRRQMLSPRQAYGLDRSAVSIKQRIWRASRNGLSRSEVRSLDRRLHVLERQVRMQVARNSRYGSRYGQRYAYGYRW